MPLYVKDSGGGDWERLEAGLYQAVCSHVVDIGVQPTQYGDKRQVVILFETAAKMSDDRPFMFSRRYAASLHEKASLRKDLVLWRGKEFTAEELKAFDLEKLIGVNCYLNIIEKEVEDGKIKNRIGGIMRLPKELAQSLIKPIEQPVPEWVRKLTNGGNGDTNGASDFAPPLPSSDEELPF